MDSMLTIPIVAVMVLLGLVIYAVVAYRHRGESREPNYRVFFVMGGAFLPLGIATDNPGFWGMGLVFLILGLLNRDKWKDEKKWAELSPYERKSKLILVGGLTIMLVVGVVAYLLTRAGRLG